MRSRLAILVIAALWAAACGSAGAGSVPMSAPGPVSSGSDPAEIDPTDPADPTDRSDSGAPEEQPPPPASSACDCSTSADEAIELHVLARDLPRDRQDALAALLAKDGFEVLFVEYADETSDPKVAIETTPSRFVAVFKGRISAQAEAMSAQDGFSCQATVEDIVIPKRYRKFIRAIRTPDPQLY
jgi:hypothetical protein